MAFTTVPAAGAKLRASVLLSLLTEVRPLGVRKGSDQTNTTTTIADDTELQLSLAANTTYQGWLFLIFNSPAAADTKIQFSIPTGTTGYWNPMTTAVATPGVIYLGALPIASQAQNEGTGADIYMRAAIDIVTTNAGTFKLQWAENAASGTMTVKAGSMLILKQAL